MTVMCVCVGRCFYVAESYSGHEKWPEALALLGRVENYCQNSLQSELEADLKVPPAPAEPSRRGRQGREWSAVMGCRIRPSRYFFFFFVAM